MKQVWPRFEQLPRDDRLWMLVWSGPFFIDPAIPSQRSLLAVVVPLRGSENRSFAEFHGRSFPPAEAFQVEHARLIPFGVGDLPALTVGMIFRQGRLLRTHWPYLRASTCDVSFRAQAVTSLQEAVDADMLPRSGLLLGDTWERVKDSRCIGLPFLLPFTLKPVRNPHAILVPVAEILRWCYGSSSRMLQTVLSSELGHVLEEVRRESRWVPPLYHLHLPEGFPEADAPTLTWLALDQQAAHAAEQVDLRLIAAAGRDHAGPRSGEAHPVIPFPFQGESFTMKFIGHTFRNARGVPHTLVHRILHLDVALPFRHVTLPRHSKRSVTTVTATLPLFSTSGGDPAGVGQQVWGLGRGEPRRGSGVALAVAPGTLFSHRDLIRYRQGEGTMLEAQVRGNSPRSPGTEFSTAPGTDADARPRRAVLYARRPRAVSEPPVVSVDFERMREALRRLAARGIASTELTLNNPSGREARFEHLIREDGQRVGCLIAELHVRDTALYVFEKERLPGEHAATLVGRRADGRLAAEEELDALLLFRARHRTWPMRQPDWKLRRLNHQFVSPETLADGLLRVIGRLCGPVLPPLLDG
ncbi:hypothetical protein E5F05_06915 [Deinococcus metallilatus]|uniref:Uncharacterized protein n=1 Tax=Deinococcus metallilatus TaxID=1211322 RepID=A0AAJ5F4J2_9DEIO|nr:hypothetical protein [Deinococcus metallilatus]MBB5294677.1 hypothetical protein [Deinococcus metallilatus]QBY07711.1 hypothetical protein E5F05_06915 [Deinococcus metallilatus]RXJ14127.1 hypothetical protein ERJ73_05750 [Deinococcus metallilatus]TLK30092.1 hypothetical protein FCS05_06065 [Deinococcus metallilatus]